MRICPQAATAAVVLAVAGFARQVPSFPGTFVRHPAVPATAARNECVALGDGMFDPSVPEIGPCLPLGLQAAGLTGNVAWIFGVYDRRWLLAPADTVAEREVVLYTKPRENDSVGLTPVWHYRYEPEMLASATPEVAPAPGGAVLLSIRECVNGTGGCGQSFALLNRGSPTTVRLAFLDSLSRRFPGGIQHGFQVNVRTLRGSVALYSPGDANCCPSTIGDFSLRLRGNTLELATLKLRRAD